MIETDVSIRNMKSFMLKHQEKEHQGRPGNYKAKVTATAKDCLTRQVREAVHLRRVQCQPSTAKQNGTNLRCLESREKFVMVDVWMCK